MITYGKWKIIPISCTNCGRDNIEARPVYKAGLQIKGLEPMEYRCKCERAIVYTNLGKYDIRKQQT